MRGLTGLRARAGDERGATLALMALAMVGLLGMAALVIDVGNGWSIRRGLIPAVDAASLAAAQDLIDDPTDLDGACDTAESYVLGNAPEASMTSCDIVALPGGGAVTVAAAEQLETSFAEPAGDTGTGSIGARATARWGTPRAVADLLPVALCHRGSTALADLIDDPPTVPTRVLVPFTPDDTTACGPWSSIGNLASVDFEDDSPLYRIRKWTRNGYPGAIVLDGPTDSGCAGVTCFDRPYVLPDLTWEMAEVVTSGRPVVFPIYDFADTYGIHIVGVLRARVIGFDLSGPAGTWYLDLDVDPGLVAGRCCGGPGVAAGNRAIVICGVDPEVLAACGPGGALS